MDTRPPPQLLRIAQAAQAIGVAPSTLRLWETQGLIAPHRRASGQRLYDDDQIRQLKQIAFLRHEQGLNPAAIRANLSQPPRDAEGGQDAGRARLARQLRSLRQDRGKTLEQVARPMGLSISALSQLERTGTGISLSALVDLAQYYGTTLSQLAGPAAAQSPLIRAGSERCIPVPVSGVRVEVLAEGERQMDCHRFILDPGATSEGRYEHDGEEFLTVIEGHFRIILDGTETHELRPGDSLYFASRRPHSWANIAPTRTVVLWINTPPTF
ncbi:MerR family transcriptional regulator [Thioclava sp. SK-1]|uniref:MerR family transcriptional regulator n=1 Tax=Thioclava sp. SK-1 TaxID=1889770 RepID=UPI000824B089|nr:MerR family transcriptional regulator [Thioclava sp. SK-1]OCX61195.1 MerR family transcriptional regulator [Thioclava sp. SK-1]